MCAMKLNSLTTSLRHHPLETRLKRLSSTRGFAQLITTSKESIMIDRRRCHRTASAFTMLEILPSARARH